MQKMAVKPRLSIECSNETVQKLKIIALTKGYASLREFVLKTMAEKYPELKESVDAELDKTISQD